MFDKEYSFNVRDHVDDFDDDNDGLLDHEDDDDDGDGVLDREVTTQSTYYIPRVPQCLFPRWNWGPPTPSPASESASPGTKRGGGHSRLRHSLPL